jgi:1-acyl-sn-glycerol-3-phosphate acyltransferase
MYYFFWIFVKLSMRFYFRQAVIANWERIPTDKPVFLAVNHGNSFLDGLFLCVHRLKPIYSLARGDVFNKPAAAWALRQFKMEPIFRAMDGGLENAKKNDETMDVCAQLLGKGHTVLIFPEGLCVPEKRLRPLKKGVSRMALQIAADTDFAMDLQIVPIGMNYTRFGAWRGEVLLEVGTPIAVRDYAAQYAEQPAKAIKLLNEVVEAQLKENVLHIAAPEDDAAVEVLLDTARTAEPLLALPWAKNTRNGGHSNRYLQEQKIIQTVNRLRETAPDAHITLKNNALAYAEALHAQRTNDRTVAAPAHAWRMGLLSWLLAPLGALGWLLNGLPLWYAHRVATEKSAGTQFFDSVLLGLGVVLYLSYWAMCGAVLHFAVGNGWWALPLPLLLWIAMLWRDIHSVFGNRFGRDAAALRALAQQRAALLAQVAA